MLNEKSAGVVIFRKDKEILYLLLYAKARDEGKAHYREKWEFPKGNVETNEDDIETAKREVQEETGLKDLKFIEDFKKKIEFFYKREGNLVHKEIVFFLAESKTEEIKLSFESNDYEWVRYEEALKKLSFKNTKDILKKANERIQNI